MGNICKEVFFIRLALVLCFYVLGLKTDDIWIKEKLSNELTPTHITTEEVFKVAVT